MLVKSEQPSQYLGRMPKARKRVDHRDVRPFRDFLYRQPQSIHLESHSDKPASWPHLDFLMITHAREYPLAHARDNVRRVPHTLIDPHLDILPAQEQRASSKELDARL